jgi:hypothetical protein
MFFMARLRERSGPSNGRRPAVLELRQITIIFAAECVIWRTEVSQQQWGFTGTFEIVAAEQPGVVG